QTHTTTYYSQSPQFIILIIKHRRSSIIMRKIITAILFTLLILSTNLPISTATTSNNFHVNTNLKIYFNGIEDVSGNGGMYDNGTSYIPKTIVYADTTYVPIRYFANMLKINQIGW